MAKTKVKMGSRHDDSYSDGHVKHMNQRLLGEGKRYCKACGKIQSVDNFQFLYYRDSKYGIATPVYSATCFTCGGA